MSTHDFPQASIQPPSSPDLDALEMERQAAAFLGVTVRALQKWRVTGSGPRFVRISSRCIRYRRRDLIAWIEARLKSSTAE
jgi:predicted DNA-binding transcriptional regulator AlpA